MRDRSRIDDFCNELAMYWKKVPDWRFGQLIQNVYGTADKDIFFMEEDESLRLFKSFFSVPEDILVILVGKTGSGKSSVEKCLIGNNYKKIITTTTRPPREGERNAKDYTFVSDEEFERYKSEGYFAETREYHTLEGVWKYGSAIKSYQNITGREVIVLTPEALEKVIPLLAKFNKQYYVVYLQSDENTIRERLNLRGDAEEEIERRLQADSDDFKTVGLFADLTIPTKGKSVEGIAGIICNYVDSKAQGNV